jgi:hypothetical protein
MSIHVFCNNLYLLEILIKTTSKPWIIPETTWNPNLPLITNKKTHEKSKEGFHGVVCVLSDIVVPWGSSTTFPTPLCIQRWWKHSQWAHQTTRRRPMCVCAWRCVRACVCMCMCDKMTDLAYICSSVCGQVAMRLKGKMSFVLSTPTLSTHTKNKNRYQHVQHQHHENINFRSEVDSRIKLASKRLQSRLHMHLHHTSLHPHAHGHTAPKAAQSVSSRLGATSAPLHCLHTHRKHKTYPPLTPFTPYPPALTPK